MQRETTVIKTDAVDRVLPLIGSHTETFQLPKLRGGAFLQVFDSPARETEYTADMGEAWPGDFRLRNMDHPQPGQGNVRLEATEDGRLASAEQVYVVTRGNRWQEAATEEVYEEEENG